MELSFILLAAGILCGFWDQLFGVRLNQAGAGTIVERARFAWDERRLTIVGSVLVLAAAVVDLLAG